MSRGNGDGEQSGVASAGLRGHYFIAHLSWPPSFACSILTCGSFPWHVCVVPPLHCLLSRRKPPGARQRLPLRVRPGRPAPPRPISPGCASASALTRLPPDISTPHLPTSPANSPLLVPPAIQDLALVAERREQIQQRAAELQRRTELRTAASVPATVCSGVPLLCRDIFCRLLRHLAPSLDCSLNAAVTSSLAVTTHTRSRRPPSATQSDCFAQLRHGRPTRGLVARAKACAARCRAWGWGHPASARSRSCADTTHARLF